MFNGLYNESIILRPKDDSFLQFKAEIVIVDSSDLLKALKYLPEKTKKNLILDDRLVNIIALLVIRHPLSVLVYNSYKCVVYNIFSYIENQYGLTGFSLSIDMVQLFVSAKLMFDYYLHMPINSQKILQTMENKKNINKKKTITEIMIDSIELQEKAIPTKEQIKYIDDVLTFLTDDKAEFIQATNMKFNISTLYSALLNVCSSL